MLFFLACTQARDRTCSADAACASCGNTGSLTYQARPRIAPAILMILIRFFLLGHSKNSTLAFLDFKFPLILHIQFIRSAVRSSHCGSAVNESD